MAESAQIAKLSHKHEAIMLWLLKNPNAQMGECAKHFKITRAWLSTIVHSDIFRSRMAVLREQKFTAAALTIQEQARAMTMLSLEKLTDKVETTDNMEMLLRISETGAKILGVGGNAPQLQPGQVAIQNNTIYVANQEELKKARDLMRRARERVTNGHEALEAEVVQDDPDAEA